MLFVMYFPLPSNVRIFNCLVNFRGVEIVVQYMKPVDESMLLVWR